MTTPLLKVCGLTNIPDLRQAQRCRADFLGAIVEVPSSPRSVSVEQAQVLARLCPDRLVAVTTSADPDQLRRIVAGLRPHALQLHSPAALAAAPDLREQTRLWLAVPVPVQADDTAAAVAQALATVEQAQAAGVEMIVLDTAVKGRTGGTGQASDWEVAAEIVRRSPLPVLLAGGISPDNAAEALARVAPAGLDASSRLELAPGRKNPLAIRNLARIVKP